MARYFVKVALFVKVASLYSASLTNLIHPDSPVPGNAPYQFVNLPFLLSKLLSTLTSVVPDYRVKKRGAESPPFYLSLLEDDDLTTVASFLQAQPPPYQ